jgi:GNAT superfamily N-acetyltransferase
MQFLRLYGKEIITQLPEIAQLRITVFREYPYLYDGSIDYEMNYLQVYVNSPRSLVFLMKDGNRVIGATTALPLIDADREFHEPFMANNINPENVYYFGESVLLPEYRGLNYGHRFFDERETRAKELGFQTNAFCSVVRDKNHPLRPKNYIPHDVFWTKRGYKKLDGFTCHYRWKDINQPEATDKLMQFWLSE